MIITLSVAAESFYFPFIEQTAAPLTMIDYQSSHRNWLRYGGKASRKSIKKLGAMDFVAFTRAARDAEKAPATINKWLRFCRTVLQFAWSERMIQHVPTIRSVREPEYNKPRPTLDQVGALYAAVEKVNPDWPAQCLDTVAWWQTFIVLGFVGALRRSDLRRLKWDHVMSDGIELRALKTGRLTFIPLLPCVRSHVDRMRSVATPGTAFILSAPGGHRQFQSAYRAIGEAADLPFRFTPQQLRRAGVDNWFEADPTAGRIVAHHSWDTAIRNYLDRRGYLLGAAKRLMVPAAFDGGAL